MMRIVIAAVVAAAMSAAGAAQSGGTMAKDSAMGKMDKMGKMGAETTYVGCLENGTAAGTYTLTHADRTGKDSVKKKDAMAAGEMDHEMMTPTSLRVASPSIDLARHVGHKVSVTGSASGMGKDAMGDMTTFTVKTLKMVATSCS